MDSNGDRDEHDVSGEVDEHDVSGQDDDSGRDDEDEDDLEFKEVLTTSTPLTPLYCS